MELYAVLYSTQAHSFQVEMCLRSLLSLSSLRECEVAPLAVEGIPVSSDRDYLRSAVWGLHHFSHTALHFSPGRVS